ncbi:MAG: amino acid transporter [Subtercola sp.]|nr:amino acid transporter [Subtercola sp.]
MARKIIRSIIWGTATAGILALTACSAGGGGSSAASATPSAAQIPLTPFSQSIHDSLPPSVLAAGKLNLVSIVLPPYAYFGADGKTLQGLNVDMAAQMKSILGIDVTLQTVPAIADVATGLASGKFDASISPQSDMASTEATFSFADWLAEYVVFLVEKGNPKGVTSLDTTCGKTIATLQGGTAETVLKQASTDCQTAGKPAVVINTFADQNTAVLAVQSGRADAAFSSQIPLSYFVETDPTLELAGTNQLNGFPKFYVGAYALKGSPVVSPMLATLQAMKASGAYTALLNSYGISANAIDPFGLNLGTAGQ